MPGSENSIIPYYNAILVEHKDKRSPAKALSPSWAIIGVIGETMECSPKPLSAWLFQSKHR